MINNFTELRNNSMNFTAYHDQPRNISKMLFVELNEAPAVCCHMLNTSHVEHVSFLSIHSLNWGLVFGTMLLRNE